MAQHVPIWYDLHQGKSVSAEACRTLQSTAAQLHRELKLSVAIAGAVEESGEITCLASSGPAAPPIGTLVHLDHGICAASVRQNRLQLSNDTASDPMASGELCARLGIRSILSVPLRRDSRCVGFLAAFSDVSHRFDLQLIRRIRTEAARVQRYLEVPGSAVLNPSPFAPNDLKSKFAREALSVEPCVDTSVVSDYQDRAVGAFVAYARPASIAVLTCCAIVMVALVPRVVRSKTSFPQRQLADMSEQLGHARQSETANFTNAINSDSSKFRDLREQAASGNVGAQVSLADRYEAGDGLERDVLKACVWYIIAGAQGDLAAKDQAVRLSRRLPQFQIAEIRFNVGKMYMQGTGVKRDLVSAYSWFVLAQAAGDVRARDEQEKLKVSMSSEQVSAGLHRASDWLLAHRSRVQ